MHRTPKRSKLVIENDTDLKPTGSSQQVFRSVDIDTSKSAVCSPQNGVIAHSSTDFSPGESRRGRPRTEFLNTLILEGSTSPSSIKCTFCSRVFPREKSLQAHLRTHTGEKPYICDYPRCTRSFAQSGQLKTHQRLHTGEKPFMCSSVNCNRRFTHANRHCSEHPDLPLRRYTLPSSVYSMEKRFDEAHNAEVRRWLLNIEKSKKSFGGAELFADGGRLDVENSMVNSDSNGSSSTESDSVKELAVETLGVKMNLVVAEPVVELTIPETAPTTIAASTPLKPIVACSNLVAPSHQELPKKRWLREAVQNQQLWETEVAPIAPNVGTNDLLAHPLKWDDIDEHRESALNTVDAMTEQRISLENQKRPTVLMCLHSGKSKQISSDDIQGAIALVELKNQSNKTDVVAALCASSGSNANNFNYRV